ncbi:SDR family NAD(P)-dependent oxidoreductase [Microbacterium sp. 18062]|uniref:SDR family NAD(P)-dependent oxidoreductase n=1 Tax=Microbacterium sp. 18062 TaxID=2681410 RepID=UPI00135BE01E|nr:SDR family oxidoreductase [Microbacterium sp. 18062]
MSARSVVVLGGAGAIGRVVCAVLAEAGMRVTVADVRGQHDTAASLPAVPAGAAPHDALDLDITDRDAVLAALGPEGSHAGYDALVVAAGLNYTGPVATTDWDAYETVLAVNLRGPFHVGQALSLNLAARPRECSAVFFSSTAGLKGEGGAAVYAASKFGVIGFMECLAAEIARHGGRANAVCPGNIDSPMLHVLAGQVAERERRETADVLRDFAAATAFERLIDIREVAHAVAFLAGPHSTGLSGQSVVIDGPPR